MLEPRFWCQNFSIYKELILFQFFQNWSGDFGVIPIFHFLKFWIASTTLCYRLVYPGTKKILLMTSKIFMKFFLAPRFQQWRGEGKSVFFDFLNYLVSPSRYINTSPGKKLLLMTRKLLNNFYSTSNFISGGFWVSHTEL